jgi:hypothetical protein
MATIKHVLALANRRSGPREFLEAFEWMEVWVRRLLIFGVGILTGFVLSAFQKGVL